MRKETKDWITAIVVLGALFYVIWFILTQSPQFVTYTDLFTVLGLMIALFGFTLNKLDKMDDKLNDLIREFSYFKGKMNGK